MSRVICSHMGPMYIVSPCILPWVFRIYISSSSSYRAGSTDIPDPLSPLLPIAHHPR